MSNDPVNPADRDALLAELRAVIEAKLAEPSPPFVYSILLAAKMRMTADRLQHALESRGSLDMATRVDLADLRAMADIVEQAELTHLAPSPARE